MKTMENKLASSMLETMKEGQRANLSTAPMTSGQAVNTSLVSIGSMALLAAAVVLVGFSTPVVPAVAGIFGAVGLAGISIAMMFSKKLQSAGARGLLIAMVILEGLMIGGLSYSIGVQDIKGTSGWDLVGQAVLSVIAVFFVMLICYKRGIIKATDGFLKVVGIGSMILGSVYLVNLVTTLFFGINFLFASGPLPILFGIVAIVFASLGLIADFKLLDDAIYNGAPESYKYNVAVGFVTSIAWLYIEILRTLYLWTQR